MTQIEPHNAEIWTCAFDFHDPSILYSGADDTFFKATDLRCNETVMLKKFGAGVCTIAPYIFDQNVIMVGGLIYKFIIIFNKKILQSLLNKTLILA